MIDVEQLKVTITVGEVLDDYQISHRRKRCVCPLHEGACNPTSFCFTDDVYYCHSCGARGDVISLLQHLLSADFKGVIEYLARRQGSDPVLLSADAGERVASIRCPSKPLKLLNLEADYAVCLEKIEVFSRRLRKLRQERKAGKVEATDFYLQEQKLDYWLEQLDTEAVRLNYDIKQFKEGEHG